MDGRGDLSTELAIMWSNGRALHSGIADVNYPTVTITGLASVADG